MGTVCTQVLPAAGHKIVMKGLGRSYCKTVLKPTQPMDKASVNSNHERNLPKSWNSRPIILVACLALQSETVPAQHDFTHLWMKFFFSRYSMAEEIWVAM